MMRIARRFAVAIALLFLLPHPLLAKRVPQKPVPPVVHDGVKYSAGGGADQYLIAADANTGKELWRVTVFHDQIWPWKEGCTQGFLGGIDI